MKFLTTNRIARPAWETALLTTAKKIFLSDNLAAWTIGQGPKVLLVHGWNGRGSQLGMFVEPLVQAGFEVIIWDGPAHGDSPGERTNVNHFAKAICKTQKELGPLHAIIAHSFGAASTVLATQYGLQVERLVLIASPCSFQEILDRFIKRMKLSPQVVLPFQNDLEREAEIKIKDLQFSHIRPSQEKILLIHDRFDQDVPYEDAERVIASWPQAKLFTTEGQGHRKILRSQEVIKKAVAFIKD